MNKNNDKVKIKTKQRYNKKNMQNTRERELQRREQKNTKFNE